MKHSSVTFCLDFGNTKKKIAIFHDDQIVHVVELHEPEIETLQNLLQQYQPQKSILSSVVQHDKEIEVLLQKHTQFILLNHLVKLPFVLPFIKKETIGADRLALMAATRHLNKRNANFLIISLGTCITYNFMNTKKIFLGGSISPGVHMRFKAMNDNTAFLPLEKLTHETPLIGYDTSTNLTSGVVLGVMYEIEGMITAYQKRYHNLHCVLTGGDADFFAQRLKKNIFADPLFIFKGLYEIIKSQGK